MDGFRVLAILTLCPLAVAAAHLVRARRDPQLRQYRYVRAGGFLVLACAYFLMVWFRLDGTSLYIVIGCGIAALVVSPWIASRQLRRTRKPD